MEFENYTERSRGFIQSAQSLAARSGHQQLSPEHILKVLLQDKEGMAAGLIQAAGGNAKKAFEDVLAELKRVPEIQGSGAGQVFISTELAKVLGQAEEIAEKAGDSYVTAERLLLALALTPDTPSHKVLAENGVTPQNLNTAIEDMRKGRKAQSATAELTGC